MPAAAGARHHSKFPRLRPASAASPLQASSNTPHSPAIETRRACNMPWVPTRHAPESSQGWGLAASFPPAKPGGSVVPASRLPPLALPAPSPPRPAPPSAGREPRRRREPCRARPPRAPGPRPLAALASGTACEARQGLRPGPGHSPPAPASASPARPAPAGCLGSAAAPSCCASPCWAPAAAEAAARDR